jgi:hypothetical protein
MSENGERERKDGTRPATEIRETKGEATEGMLKPRRPRLLRWAKTEEGPFDRIRGVYKRKISNISNGLARMIHMEVRTTNEGQSIFF